jgi:hypothetical protein
MRHACQTRPSNPATPRQIEYLSSLLERKDLREAPIHVDHVRDLLEAGWLNRADASAAIDALVPLPWKPRERKAPADSVEVEEGWFVEEKTGEIAVVKFNRQKTRKYAMRARLEKDPSGFVPHPDEDVDPDEYLEERDHPVRLSWDYEAGLISKIARGGWRKMTKEEAASFGRLYGVCLACGRTLTDPESIERGIGPICASKF